MVAPAQAIGNQGPDASIMRSFFASIRGVSMRWPPLGLICASTALTAACGGSPLPTASSTGPPIQERQLTIDGQARGYRLYKPASLDPLRAAPLVIVLHAAARTGDDAASTTGFDQAADGGRFVVAYPSGLHKNWNAGFCCEPQSHVDDTRFLSRLLDQLEADNHIDPTRVYVVGQKATSSLRTRSAGR
jgi:polyhydroxybutyrate depolymerase